MSLLAPAFLIAAGTIAAAVVALHFIVTREPRTAPLPTARFAPDLPVHARSRALHLQDLLLLLLRVLFILTVGAALAQPVILPPRRDSARIVLVDRSRAVADRAELLDSARVLLRDGDALVLFADSAFTVREGFGDTLASLQLSPHGGRISAALVQALRTASVMRDAADSIQLVLLSPLAREELDAASDSVRLLWPGALRLVRVSARLDTATASSVQLEGAADDPLQFALRSTATFPARDTVRVVRGSLTASDSAWVEANDGRTLVHWPAQPFEGDAPALSPIWRALATHDTVGAVAAGEAVVVAPFERYAAFAARTDSAVRVVARWVDGEPAATESAAGRGCIRTVTVPVPARGDLVLTPRFARFTAAMVRSCGAGNDDVDAITPASVSRTAALGLAARPALVPHESIAPPERTPQPLVPWLFAAALVFALFALLVRRRSGNVATRLDEERT
jgi:hypothetical protein